MYPIILEIGSFRLETYFVVISLALVIGTLYALKRGDPLIKKTPAFFDLLIVMIICAYIGGRIFHIIFEMPKFYFANPLEIFKVWKGGFVAYGSHIFAILGGVVFIKIKKLPPLKLADILAPPMVLTISIGRISCFLTGCCYGKPTNSIFGLTFPKGGAAPYTHPIHPTQLYMSFSALLIFLFLLFVEKKYKKVLNDGFLFSLLLILYPTSRFIVEFYRDDFRGITIGFLSISQLFSIFLVLFGIALLFFKTHKSK